MRLGALGAHHIRIGDHGALRRLPRHPDADHRTTEATTISLPFPVKSAAYPREERPTTRAPRRTHSPPAACRRWGIQSDSSRRSSSSRRACWTSSAMPATAPNSLHPHLATGPEPDGCSRNNDRNMAAAPYAVACSASLRGSSAQMVGEVTPLVNMSPCAVHPAVLNGVISATSRHHGARSTNTARNDAGLRREPPSGPAHGPQFLSRSRHAGLSNGVRSHAAH